MFDIRSLYLPIELPTWITLPSGIKRYVKNIEDAKYWANLARDEYLDGGDKSDKKKEEALADYQWIKKYVEEFPKRRVIQHEKPQNQAQFPIEFDAPSGHKYVFKTWNELKNFEDPQEFAKILEYKYKTDKENRSKEQIAQALQRDIQYLRGEREKIYERGHIDIGDEWSKGLTDEEWGREYFKRKDEEKAKEKLEKKLKREKEEKERAILEQSMQEVLGANEPPKATAAPQATTAPAQVNPEAPTAGAPLQATGAPQQPRMTETPKTRENFYGINEPNFPMNVLFPDDIKVVQRNLGIENKADYERIINKLKDGIQKAKETGDTAVVENYSKALKHVEETYNRSLNERRKKETPAYVKNPDGSVIDTRTHEVVDPERIRLAAAQERSSQIAGKPFKRNPFEANPVQQDPLLSQGIQGVEQELGRQYAPNPETSPEFKYPEQTPQQKLAAAMYMNPDRGRHGLETLRDSILEQSRQRAIRRLNQSFEDLGRQYSANRMGRNSLFEAQKGRMMKDVMEDLNLLDHETELKLRAMNEQQLGGRAQFSQGQYESEAQRALEQYKINQQRKEQELARRRQAASDAIAAGTLRQNLAEQNRARQSAEFMREQNFPREQLRSHLDELRASTLGMPAMPQEERRNVPAPRLVPQAAPPALEREIAATAGAPPQQAPPPPADTTFKDIAGTVLGGLGLGLQYKKFNADEAARQAGKT